MEQEVEKEDPRLDLARQLIEQLSAENEDGVNSILSELTQIRQNNLFCEVGKLTRDLHETLNNFRMDTRISSLAEREIPDAKKRLNHVIEMTEKSALRTLQAVESSVPLSHAVRNRMAHFKKSWERFRRREMTPSQFRQLNRDMDVFLEQTDGEISQIHGNLSEILLAQETQDLSGQIIRQVIQLVQNVETSLVELIRITGQNEIIPSKQNTCQDHRKGLGPAVPELDSEDTVQSQDEVDELLSSLGF